MNKSNECKQSKRKGKSKRFSNTKRSRDRDVETDFPSNDKNYNAQRSTPNDWRWYAQNEALLRDTASFSYNNPVGSRIYLGQNAGIVANSTSVPGICAIYTRPAFGNASNNPNAPVNIAARNIYSYVRHANAGHTNYDAPDLMLYLLAMDSCYSYLEYLKRVYGVMMTYSYTNRYYPVAMIHAMDVNFDDIQSKLSDFRAYINMFAVKVGSFCVPASMSYMARHMWMYSGYYVDTPDNDKAQTYLYVPEVFYQYGLDTDGAGCLVPLDFNDMDYSSAIVYPSNSADGHTLQTLISFGNSLIDPILMSEDMNVMSGDILKAFGPENVYKVASIDEKYTVLPTYSEEVLNQINNATLVGRGFHPNWQRINSTAVNPEHANVLVQSSDKSYLTMTGLGNYKVYLSDGYDLPPSGGNMTTVEQTFYQVAGSNKLINFDHGNINPSDTMVATRLTNIAVGSTLALNNYTTTSNTVYAWRHVTENPSQPIHAIANYTNTQGSDVASFAKIWYWAYPNRGQSSVWSLISTEDIYEVLFTTMRISTQDNPNYGSQLLNIAQKSGDDFRRAAFMSVFNRHPAFAQVITFSTVTGTTTSDTVWASIPFSTHLNDVNYYTILDAENLENLAQTALLSEFDIKQYGRAAQ